jgi:hypothetical protein
MPKALPYNGKIATVLKDGIRNGVAIKDLMASIQGMQNAPASTNALYRLYGKDMAEAKADIVGRIGGTVVDQALDGDFKSQELFLRSRGGWSPSSHVEEQDVGSEEEETEGAVSTLMGLLGKTSGEDEHE